MQCSIPLSELVDETTWGEFQKRDGDELALQMTNPSETVHTTSKCILIISELSRYNNLN